MSDEQTDLELDSIEWLYLESQSIIYHKVLEWDNESLDEKFMDILRKHHELYLRLILEAEEVQLEMRRRGVREKDRRRHKLWTKKLNTLRSWCSTSKLSVSKVNKRMQARQEKQKPKRKDEKRLVKASEAKKQDKSFGPRETQTTSTNLQLWERSEINLPMANIQTAKLFDVKVIVDEDPYPLFYNIPPRKLLKIRYDREKIEYKNARDIFHTPRIWREVSDNWDEGKHGPIEESYLWDYQYKMVIQLDDGGLMIMGFSEFWVRMIMRFLGEKQKVMEIAGR
ncbi:hypothetical protein EAF04_005045 [Stromatinia cepivora]|nr:hypothetical protein EAF04_005045 [Stromatinia cepivora]